MTTASKMSSWVVQILLPLRDNDGIAFDARLFAGVRARLTERFGGVTSYSRAPAKGVWKEDGGDVVTDDVIVYEVVVDALDTEWWRAYGSELQEQFRQDEIMMRALPCTRL